MEEIQKTEKVIFQQLLNILDKPVLQDSTEFHKYNNYATNIKNKVRN